jgi:hypothetical protein
MLKFIKSLFGKKEEAPVVEVPYKVEPTQSYESIKTPKVESPVAEQAVEAVVKSIAPAKKQPAAKKTTAPKVAKPKAPRKPKATK